MSFTVAGQDTVISSVLGGGRRGVVAWTSAAVVTLLVVCGSAAGTTNHGFTDQFGGPGNGAGEFSGGPLGIGVLASSGDVFAVDPGHALGDGSPDPRVERFNSAGAFQSAFSVDGSVYGSLSGLAVDSSASGAVYVSAIDNAAGGVGVVLKYTPAGVFVHGLDAAGSGTTINGAAPVAVDPADGSVYAMATVVDTGVQVVAVFDGATGAFVSSFDGTSSGGTGFACVTALAADASGNVYVFDPCLGHVDRLSSSGAFIATVANAAPAGVAVDPVSGQVFVAEYGASGLQVTQFSAGGTTPGQRFGASNVVSLAGMTVDPNSGTVFSADNASAAVQRFAAFEGPTVNTTAASDIEPASVTLNGTIDPEGVAASYHFAWGVDSSYGTTTADIDAGSGTAPIPAAAAIFGLRPNSVYHYRIIGSNGSGSITGDDQTVTTAPVIPTVDGAPFVTEIESDGANVHTTVNAGHSPTTFHVDYGTSIAYGATSAEASAGSADGPAPVAATLTDLAPGTLYHYRVTADNGTGGPQHGTDGTFITAPAAPAGATDLTTKRAKLTGTVDPHGSETTYHFNYGPTASYGARTREADAGSGHQEQLVTEQIAGLSPNTTYHVQVVATSGGLTWTGADGTFTTPPGPVATLSDATAITTSSATVAGSVETYGQPGSYRFELSSLTGSYEDATTDEPTPAGVAPHAVAVGFSGLPAGETFVARLVVTSNDATDYSDQITFATAPQPKVFPASPPPAAIYGCVAPNLDTFNEHPKPGETISITGRDLGVGGAVMLGAAALTPSDWKDTGFSIDIPGNASGTLPLTVNCGHMSETIAIALFHQPDNVFTVAKHSVAGTTATLSARFPGPGKVQTSGSHIRPATTTITGRGTRTIKVRLSAGGTKALRGARTGKLKVTVRVRYIPVGGQSSTRTIALTYIRGGSSR